MGPFHPFRTMPPGLVGGGMEASTRREDGYARHDRGILRTARPARPRTAPGEGDRNTAVRPQGKRTDGAFPEERIAIKPNGLPDPGDRATFEAIVKREINPFAAMLRGTVGVEGDPELIVQFQRLLREERS